MSQQDEQIVRSNTPIEGDWTTWPDAELMGRLLRRGAEPVNAKGLVRDRVREDAAAEINEILAIEYKDAEDRTVRLETPLDRRARR